MRAHGARVNPGIPDFEQRLASLATPVERLQHAAGDPPSAEQRLAQLTEECADIVRRWALTSERHARAVTRFEAHLAEWNEAGARLEQNAAERIDGLEKLILQEWSELKQLHDDPVRQLSEHATSLTQVCIATANAAQQGFERSEARLAAIEGELNRRLSELTREVHAVVADLRVSQQSLAPVPATPQAAWPLEGVTKLHHQLRTDPTTDVPTDVLAVPPAATPLALLPAAAGVLGERIESLERALSDRDTTIKETAARSTRSWQLGTAVLASLVLIGALIAVGLRRDVQEATQRAEQATAAQIELKAEAERQVQLTRDEAAKQLADMQARADRAQLVGDVLAAADARSYNLVGRRALAGRAALLRWSESRGLVFSGSLLPAAPAGSTYQVWLLTPAGPVGAGTFVPDAAGAVTLAAAPPQIAAAVTGALVTIEPEGGRTTPLGEVVLARPLPPPAPAPEPVAPQ